MPPLKYDYVYRLKADFPELNIILNGGVIELDEAASHLLKGIDGVMLGREVYHNPYILASVDTRFYNDPHSVSSREDIALGMRAYIGMELEAGTALKHITRHMLGLLQGVSGARAWRRHLSQHACRADAGWEVIMGALEAVAEVRSSNRPITEMRQQHV